jgi:hypothetical protein
MDALAHDVCTERVAPLPLALRGAAKFGAARDVTVAGLPTCLAADIGRHGIRDAILLWTPGFRGLEGHFRALFSKDHKGFQNIIGDE